MGLRHRPHHQFPPPGLPPGRSHSSPSLEPWMPLCQGELSPRQTSLLPFCLPGHRPQSPLTEATCPSWPPPTFPWARESLRIRWSKSTSFTCLPGGLSVPLFGEFCQPSPLPIPSISVHSNPPRHGGASPCLQNDTDLRRHDGSSATPGVSKPWQAPAAVRSTGGFWPRPLWRWHSGCEWGSRLPCEPGMLHWGSNLPCPSMLPREGQELRPGPREGPLPMCPSGYRFYVAPNPQGRTECSRQLTSYRGDGVRSPRGLQPNTLGGMVGVGPLQPAYLGQEYPWVASCTGAGGLRREPRTCTLKVPRPTCRHRPGSYLCDLCPRMDDHFCPYSGDMIPSGQQASCIQWAGGE